MISVYKLNFNNTGSVNLSKIAFTSTVVSSYNTSQITTESKPYSISISNSIDCNKNYISLSQIQRTQDLTKV